MSENESPAAARRRADGERADQQRQAVIAGIGAELMTAFNRGKTDPAQMAMLGHDTATGFEFVIERNGEVYVWSGTRDLS